MNRTLTGALLACVLSYPAMADERITAGQIQQVMDATDAAAMDRDAARIGAFLDEAFVKVIEFQYKNWMAKVKIDKYEYLQMIDAGWAGIGDYDYQRQDTEIHIQPDGHSGQSYSTIIEHMVLDGREMTSRYREYATYILEGGKPVIKEISGHTLLGDTTPY